MWFPVRLGNRFKANVQCQSGADVQRPVAGRKASKPGFIAERNTIVRPGDWLAHQGNGKRKGEEW
jgi:hypothetical protein